MFLVEAETLDQLSRQFIVAIGDLGAVKYELLQVSQAFEVH